MVTLDTFRALREHDHQLAEYGPTCERWAVLDPESIDTPLRDRFPIAGSKYGFNRPI
jgi:hypothetical protein